VTGGLRQLTDAGDRIFRIRSRFNIGRDVQNDLVLTDPVVSNWHTSVEEHAGGFVVVDHNSLNGTYVQRGGAEPTRVHQRQPLLPGDVIRIGSARLVFESSVPTPSSAPTPTIPPVAEHQVDDPTSGFPATLHGRILPAFLADQVPEASDTPLGSPAVAGRLPEARNKPPGSQLAAGQDPVLERLKSLEERVAHLESELRRLGRTD
jgi:pSer/pThr/pTyr-binding forkhead associated (FHA) protein